MKFRLITDYRAVRIEKNQWNDLAAQNQTNTIFQTHEWFHSWWQTCGHDYRLAIVTCEENGLLTGIAPFMISIEKNGKHLLRFACDINSDYCDILVKGNKQPVITGLISYLFYCELEFDTIMLRNIPSYSTTHDYLFAACKSLDIPVNFGLPTVTSKLLVKGHGDVVARTLNKYSIKRPYNKMLRAGEVRLKIVDTTDRVTTDHYLNDFFEQHINRYASIGKKSLFAESKYRQFYSKLLEEMRAAGWVNFSVLELNGQAVAYHFGFIYDQNMIWYKPSFDINLARLSPGSALLRQLIEHCQLQDLSEFDFTIGDESYKQRFSNITTYNKNIYIHKSSFDYYLLKCKRLLARISRKFLNALSQSWAEKMPGMQAWLASRK